MDLLFKSRTGQELSVQPVGLSPTTLSQENFGLDDYTLAKIDGKHGFAADALAKRAKRGKMRKALWHENVPTDIRNRIIDFSRKVERESMTADDSSPQAPGARGGSALSNERSALAGDVMSRGDIPEKIQARLVALVYDAAPITLIAPRTAYEGAEPYPADEPYPGK